MAEQVVVLHVERAEEELVRVCERVIKVVVVEGEQWCREDVQRPHSFLFYFMFHFSFTYC